MVCYHCGKGVLMGRTHTHHRGVAGGRWKKRAPKKQRVFFPNLQIAYIMEKGKEKRVKLCTKCLKRIKKDVRDGKSPFVVLAVKEAKNKPALVKTQETKTEKKKSSKKSKKLLKN